MEGRYKGGKDPGKKREGGRREGGRDGGREGGREGRREGRREGGREGEGGRGKGGGGWREDITLLNVFIFWGSVPMMSVPMWYKPTAKLVSEH